ncbi:unnamed protein product [Darwinula stevensoni]|uniref:SSD domain-containing protein n=1 Tax=Darwinula stevensoni TaxID=69355 RepID=A0A7R9A9T5_9CRUS|nr:unnamed protein product [Darwinula stevensoni]CAG0897763.1 unnamed protein product [Darwinula stevensoni]
MKFLVPVSDNFTLITLCMLMIDPVAHVWEKKFIEAVFHSKLHKPHGIYIYAFATRSFRDGISEMLYDNALYFVLGFALVTIYVSINLGRCNFLQQRVYLGLAAVFSIILTVLSAIGLCLYLGILPGELHNLMPFLILGIGIDDTLVIVQCLEMVLVGGETLTVEERVGEALKRAGVSITITSLTDIFAFCMGATTKIPMLRSFCIYTAVGIFIVYVMTLIFIVPILSLDEKRRDSRRESCLCIPLPDDYKTSSCSQNLLLNSFFDRIVGPVLVKTPAKVVVVILTMGLLGLNCWGMSGLKLDFDRTWYLGPGYQRDFLSALRNLFPESGYRAEFYLGNVDYFKERVALEELYTRMSALPGLKDRSVKFWYHSFLEYLQKENGMSF